VVARMPFAQAIDRHDDAIAPREVVFRLTS
jgi:hypothetical protein